MDLVSLDKPIFTAYATCAGFLGRAKRSSAQIRFHPTRGTRHLVISPCPIIISDFMIFKDTIKYLAKILLIINNFKASLAQDL